MGMCMRYAKDEDRAMQILNDGLLKVFMNLESYSGKGSFEGWIRRIVFRSLADHFRKENKYLRFIVFDEPETRHESVALEKLYYEDILNCVELLPDKSKEVFKLFAIEGYTHQEIGEQLNISEGTSKWHLSNARMKLKSLLKHRLSEQYAG
jgi:RNA polymerase sigma-70 factor (ECF subfamily)